MTETEATQVASDQRTVTAEILKARLDEMTKVTHSGGCDCPGTETATVADMLQAQQEVGGFKGSGPWTEHEAAEILAWWDSPLEPEDVARATAYTPEDVDAIVASILGQGVTPAERRTGISDRKAAVLDGLVIVKASLPAFAAASAALALAVAAHAKHPHPFTAAIVTSATEEMQRIEGAIVKAIDMLTAVVKSME